jgi:hypothetical protein
MHKITAVVVFTVALYWTKLITNFAHGDAVAVGCNETAPFPE